MKKIVLVLAIAITMVSCYSVQTVPASEPIIETVVSEGDKDQNYVKANEWMVSNFNNAESVIQFSDKEAGIVKGKYLMMAGSIGTQYTVGTPSYHAIITIRVKDGASRIEISPTGDFSSITYMGTNIGMTPVSFEANAKQLIESFKALMVQKSVENW